MASWLLLLELPWPFTLSNVPSAPLTDIFGTTQADYLDPTVRTSVIYVNRIVTDTVVVDITVAQSDCGCISADQRWCK